MESEHELDLKQFSSMPDTPEGKMQIYMYDIVSGQLLLASAQDTSVYIWYTTTQCVSTDNWLPGYMVTYIINLH